jgi:hypothetical protein
MLGRSRLVLLIALTSVCVAGVASAQVGLSTKPDYDLIYKADRVEENAEGSLAALRKSGFEALQLNDFAGAEAIFGTLVQRTPTTVDANFLLGIAKLGLAKWGEAKQQLEIAVAREPVRPEPKTRLGLAYIALNDVDAARAQRAALANLDRSCRQSCSDAEWISEGLAVLDRALVPGASIAYSGLAVRVESVATGDRSTTPGLAASSSTPASQTPTGTKDLDPSAYSMVSFDDPHDLYNLLTQEGRCPPNEMAERRQPCALILYRPVDDAGEGLGATFKPVFKVESRNMIWAIHDKKLQKIRIENLYFDNDDIIGKKRAAYRSEALIGNAENAANCKQARPCLDSLVTQDMFRMYSNMPDSVVEVLWGSGMKDPGTVRVR